MPPSPITSRSTYLPSRMSPGRKPAPPVGCIRDPEKQMLYRACELLLPGISATTRRTRAPDLRTIRRVTQVLRDRTSRPSDGLQRLRPRLSEQHAVPDRPGDRLDATRAAALGGAAHATGM